jgi:hypothetical protein
MLQLRPVTTCSPKNSKKAESRNFVDNFTQIVRAVRARVKGAILPRWRLNMANMKATEKASGEDYADAIGPYFATGTVYVM